MGRQVLITKGGGKVQLRGGPGGEKRFDLCDEAAPPILPPPALVPAGGGERGDQLCAADRQPEYRQFMFRPGDSHH